MAAEDKVPIEFDISSKHDPKGVDDAKAGFAGLEKGINSVAQKAELLGKVMRGLGYIAIVQQAISLYNSLRDRMNAAKEAAEKLADQQADAKAKQAIEDQKTAYDNLKNSMAALNAELARKAELEAISQGGARGIEDARSLVSEQTELSGISFDDPERKEKEDAVRAKYARQRAITSASREKEDAVLARQRFGAEAETKDKAALSVDEQASETERLLEAQRAQQKHWRTMAQKSMSWGSFYDNIRYHGPEEKPSVETPESKAFAAKAEAAEKRAAELEKLWEDQRKNAASLRTEAEQSRGKAAATYGVVTAADIKVNAADMEGSRNVRSADYAVDAARTDRETKTRAQADDLANKQAQAEALREKAGTAETELHGLRTTAQREMVDVDRAQYAYDKLPSRQRKGREGQALEAEVRRQEAEAREANTALAEAIPSLGKIISESLEQAKRLEAEVKKALGRQSNSRTETGNID